MGSSTAAGNGAPPGKGWVAVLGQTLSDRGIQVINIAKASTVTYNGLSSSTAPTPNRPAPDPAINIDQALSRRPVALLLAYPTNDTGSGYGLDETVNNLMAIRATALASSVPVMVLSTQPRNLPDAQRAMLKDINVKLASEVGPCFVNVYDSLAGPDGRLLPSYDSGDGTHPNEAGHRVIATVVQTAIENAKCLSVVR
jgi:lysophospholipase L1-like esterase